MALPQVNGEFRLGADPELRFAPSGVAVCKIRAVASSRKKEGDTWVDDKKVWVNLTLFDKAAENAAESFEKGNLVTVIGRLQVDEWNDNNGNKRESVQITVDSMGPSVKMDAARVLVSERTGARGGAPAPQTGSSNGAESPWGTNEGSPPPF